MKYILLMLMHSMWRKTTIKPNQTSLSKIFLPLLNDIDSDFHFSIDENIGT